MASCPGCGGAGVCEGTRRSIFGLQRTREACPECRGAGRVVRPDAVCATCAGVGAARKRHAVTVELPPGAASGERIVKRGEGDFAAGGEGGGGAHGDAAFVVGVETHPVLQRPNDGDHLVPPPHTCQTLTCCVSEPPPVKSVMQNLFATENTKTA